MADNTTGGAGASAGGNYSTCNLKLKKREWVFTRSSGGCYRGIVLHEDPAKDPSKVRTLFIPAVRSYAHKTLFKCREDASNTERVFVPGDAVTIMGGSVVGPEDNVWILVEKRRTGKLKAWMRPLDEVRSRVVEKEALVLECPVFCEGAMKSGPSAKAPDLECFAVSLDGKERGWVEAGLFQEAVYDAGSRDGTCNSSGPAVAGATQSLPGRGWDGSGDKADYGCYSSGGCNNSVNTDTSGGGDGGGGDKSEAGGTSPSSSFNEIDGYSNNNNNSDDYYP